MVGAVVIVKRKKKITFHSRLQRFATEEERDMFISRSKKALKELGHSSQDIKIYRVSSEPIEPTEEPKRGYRYCPYCSQIIKLKKGEFGSRVCPICGISEQEFYFKKYNKLK